MPSRTSTFSIQDHLLSIRSSSTCLLGRPLLPVTTILPSIYRSVTCFSRQFPRKMWPIQLAFHLRALRRIFFSSSTLCNTSSFFTQSVQMISAILLQHYILKLSRNSGLLFEVSKLQHHTKLYSKCSTLLVSSSNLSPICWRKEFSACLMLLVPWKSWISFHVSGRKKILTKTN